MSKSFKVKHRKSGLTYRLTPKTQGYYLSANDGMVPSGQMIYWDDKQINRVFEKIK